MPIKFTKHKYSQAYFDLMNETSFLLLELEDNIRYNEPKEKLLKILRHAQTLKRLRRAIHLINEMDKDNFILVKVD